MSRPIARVITSRISDIAAAAEAARAAATTARVNIEINLGGIADADARDELRETCQLVDELAEQAAATVQADGVPREAHRVEHSADLRFHGQGFEVPVVVGHYHLVSFLLNSLGVPLEDGSARFP